MKIFQNYAAQINNIILSIINDSVPKIFPIESSNRRLELVKIEKIDLPNLSDLEEFSQTKINRGSWAARVVAKLKLVDKKSNKTIDEASITLFNLPIATPNGTFLVDGNEYVIPTQLRLKPGTYYDIESDGTIESRVHLSEGENFRIVYDPQNGTLRLIQNGKSIKLLPLLRALGAKDEQMIQAWGKELFEFIKSKDDGSIVQEAEKFVEAAKSKRYQHLWEGTENLSAPLAAKMYLSRTKMDPEVNKITLEKGYTNVSAEHLIDTVKKMIQVSKQQAEPMRPTSLIFKSAHAPWHFIADTIKEVIKLTQATFKDRIEKFDTIRQIVVPTYFQRPIDRFFLQSSVVQYVMTPNPIALLQNMRKATYFGEGGIRDDRAATPEQRSVDPYYIGFLDPSHTPEGERIGANLYLSVGAGPGLNEELYSKFYDVKKKKMVTLRPIDLFDKKVAFPKEGTITSTGVQWKNPLSVKVIYKNKIIDVPANEVDLIVPEPRDMFDNSSNLLPFLDSLQGNRGMMAAKHLLQAINLKEKEPPLVQVKFTESETEEQHLGKAFALTAPEDGQIVSVSDKQIVMRGASGQTYQFKIYKDLPLAQGGFLSYDVKVKPGDRVKKGAILADNNFTKGGTIATGVNLRVAYMPWKGYNFEDGIVITESAAKKLASEHLYTLDFKILPNMELGKEKFQAAFPEVYTVEQLNKLDSSGVVKENVTLNPGDPVVLCINKLVRNDWKQLDPALQNLPDVRNTSMEWDYAVPGTVTKVVKSRDNIRVFVKTIEPAKVGDKLAGRHGNKGTISLIIPDSEAPRTKDGKIIDIIMNPIGVPSRINPSQLLESAAGKVAEKMGKPFVVENFSDKDNTETLLKLLKTYNIPEKEKLIIPGEGETETEVFTGIQYINKLEQQVDKKNNIREEWKYDIDLQPLRGSQEGGGARAIDPLTLFSLISHNVRNIIKEMATYKAEKNDEFWLAVELGKTPPAPKPTFAFEKFTNYLKAAGINVEKKHDELIIKPLSDEEVLKMAPNEITDAGFIKSFNLKPEKNGLFDPDIFGGVNGSKWAHVKLPVPVLNPVFADVVRNILGLSKGEMEKLIQGQTGVDENGKIVPSENAKYFGGEAFKKLLENLNVDKKIQEIQKIIEKSPYADEVAKYVRQLKVLRAIQAREIDPKNFVISVIPVLPPLYRPVYPSEDESFFIVSPVNYRYRDLILTTKLLKENLAKGTISEDSLKKEWAGKLYKSLERLTMVGMDRDQGRGIIPFLAGEESPKGGFIHSKLLRRRQELSSTAVIENGPELDIDEVGLPEEFAWNLYKPFIVKRLTEQGYSLKDAKENVEKRTEAARVALQREIENRPVLLNRSPSLHKFSIMAFKPVLTKEQSIKLNPLVTKGFNADFDGDTMGIHIPVTEEAKREAIKILPSNVLFKPATKTTLMPTLRAEYVGAIFNLTVPATGKPKRIFSEYDALLEAWMKRQVKHTDIVRFQNVNATVGQHLINGLLPRQFRDYKEPWDGKKITRILVMLALRDKDLFKQVIDTWKEIARTAMIRLPFSIALSDFKDKTFEPLKKALSKVEKIKDPDERLAILTQIIDKTTKIINDQSKKMYDKNNLYNMFASGAKGSATQIRQVVLSPIMVTDHTGAPLPLPIKNSYAEGFTPAEYFISSFGSRHGMLSKKLGVAEPGAINKEIINTLADLVVSAEDDKEDPGLPMNTNNSDIINRVLAQDVKVRGRIVAKAGDIITPDLRDKFIKLKVDIVYIKSPITSTTAHGIPATSVGILPSGNLPQIGENIGVQAGQDLTEPLSQETMNLFHTGGVKETKMNILDTVKYLLHMPKSKDLKAAILAQKAGKVEKISDHVSGGKVITIDGVDHYVPPQKNIIVKVNDKVYKGQPLTDGVIHPLELAKLRSLKDAQKALAEQLYQSANESGIKLTHSAAEVIARGAASAVAVVSSPVKSIPIGAVLPVQYVERLNMELSSVKEVPVEEAKGKRLAQNAKDVLVGTLIDDDIIKELKDKGVKKVKVYEDVIRTVPIVRGTMTQPLYKEDWLHKMTYSRLKQTIPWSAASAEKSKLDTMSPLSAWMYGANIGYKEQGKY